MVGEAAQVPPSLTNKPFLQTWHAPAGLEHESHVELVTVSAQQTPPKHVPDAHSDRVLHELPLATLQMLFASPVKPAAHLWHEPPEPEPGEHCEQVSRDSVLLQQKPPLHAPLAQSSSAVHDAPGWSAHFDSVPTSPNVACGTYPAVHASQVPLLEHEVHLDVPLPLQQREPLQLPLKQLE